MVAVYSCHDQMSTPTIRILLKTRHTFFFHFIIRVQKKIAITIVIAELSRSSGHTGVLKNWMASLSTVGVVYGSSAYIVIVSTYIQVGVIVLTLRRFHTGPRHVQPDHIESIVNQK